MICAGRSGSVWAHFPGYMAGTVAPLGSTGSLRLDDVLRVAGRLASRLHHREPLDRGAGGEERTSEPCQCRTAPGAAAAAVAAGSDESDPGRSERAAGLPQPVGLARVVRLGQRAQASL